MPVRKRELASYLLLYSSSRDAISMSDAENLLELMLPRRSVRSVIRTLAKSGFIEVIGREIKINRPEEALGKYLSQYIASRIERNAKSKKIPYRAEKEQDRTEKIYIEWTKCIDTTIAIGRTKIICQKYREK